jgi:hypothetical protein
MDGNPGNFFGALPVVGLIPGCESRADCWRLHTRARAILLLSCLGDSSRPECVAAVSWGASPEDVPDFARRAQAEGE